MNKDDLNNLGYLMNLSEADFDQWMDAASGNDIDYALELISKHREEIQLKEYLLRVDNVDVSDTEEAKLVLQKFRI